MELKSFFRQSNANDVNQFHGSLFGRLLGDEVGFSVAGGQVVVLYPACLCRNSCLSPIMESTDPRLISCNGSQPLGSEVLGQEIVDAVDGVPNGSA